MKTLRSAALILLIIHAAALIGFAVWLWGSDRLSRERLSKVVQTLKPTVAAEKLQVQADAKQKEEDAAKAAEAARLQSIGDGPMTVGDRLGASAQADQLALLRVERIQREKQDLLHQLDVAKDLIAKQRTDLDAMRKQFEDARAQEVKQRDDRDFQHVIETYEALKPRQVKDMFGELLSRGQMNTVVDYLAAMDTRKAAAVLKEFKTTDETAQAVEIVQRLRSRGVTALAVPGAPGSTGGAGACAGTTTQPAADAVAAGTAPPGPSANVPLATP